MLIYTDFTARGRVIENKGDDLETAITWDPDMGILWRCRSSYVKRL